MNGLHGVLIFCVLVLCRRRIRKELAGKRILCCMAPASWSQIEYPEEEHLNIGDGKIARDKLSWWSNFWYFCFYISDNNKNELTAKCWVCCRPSLYNHLNPKRIGSAGLLTNKDERKSRGSVTHNIEIRRIIFTSFCHIYLTFTLWVNKRWKRFV